MSLSHQSLRKFDTFINFVQIYLLTQKLGTIQAQKPVPFTWRCICWNEHSLPHRDLQSNFTKESKKELGCLWLGWILIYGAPVRGEVPPGSRAVMMDQMQSVPCGGLCLGKEANRKSCKEAKDARHFMTPLPHPSITAWASGCRATHEPTRTPYGMGVDRQDEPP